MYATEYDLVVAENWCDDRRNEMTAIRTAQAAHDEQSGHPTLMDRLVTLTGIGLHTDAPHDKVSAAA